MKLRRATLSEDAYGAVRGMLLDARRFRPGDKISVEALARDLGVSRSPVWSAIARLDAEGLVEVAPRKGVFLVAFAPEKLHALFEAREALEGMAARLAARRITAAGLIETASQIARQRAAVTRKDVAFYSKATLAFHAIVTDAARNDVIAGQLSAIYDQMHAICGGALAKIGWPGRRLHIADHAALLAALRRRDADGAERAARAHARRLADGVLGRLDA